jgi:flagellar biosynthesis/type III secretory pathway M-ring protein FliF/YscJ
MSIFATSDAARLSAEKLKLTAAANNAVANIFLMFAPVPCSLLVFAFGLRRATSSYSNNVDKQATLPAFDTKSRETTVIGADSVICVMLLQRIEFGV